ncbi:hypothetical protein [Aurantibacter sp.]|uniref:hypothetical protein n=1 Tax=Aurantibacter sp. TaxID=2807103 RepID=UPI003267825D
MRINNLLSAILILLTTMVCAQDQFHTDLKGKVYSADGDVAATHILNISSNKFTISDIDGFFEIPVKLFDTLVISAVQFKRKEIVVTLALLEQELAQIQMEDALTELSEVVVRPYNLSGDLSRDAANLNTGRIITASTLNLPNAYVKLPSKAERELFAATANPIMSVDPLINAITGRTKMLKQRVQRNSEYNRTQRVRAFYVDSLFRTDLKIPEEQIDAFMYFCEVDDSFQTIVDSHDRLKIWEYMRRKSVIYRKNNGLD